MDLSDYILKVFLALFLVIVSIVLLLPLLLRRMTGLRIGRQGWEL